MSINMKSWRKELGNTTIEGVGRRLTAVVREAGDQGEAGVMDVREGHGFEKYNVRQGETRTRVLEGLLHDRRG